MSQVLMCMQQEIFVVIKNEKSDFLYENFRQQSIKMNTIDWTHLVYILDNESGD